MASHRPRPAALLTACLAAALVVGGAAAQPFDDPDYATLVGEPLHDLPLPEPGRFWLEFEGEVHEGELRECAVLEPTESARFHRFDASGAWLNHAGQARAFEMFRFVSGEEAGWRFIGHETDRVSVTTRLDGDIEQVASGTIDATMPRARAEAQRREPLGEVRMQPGEGDVPLVRVSADLAHATAMAVLDVHPVPPNQDYYDDDTVHVTGPIAIAVRCGS